MNPSYGGIERVTDLLSKEFVRRGHNIIYLCTTVIANQLDCAFPAEQIVLPYSGGFENEENVKFYSHLLNEHKIDIVINQRGWAPFMNNVIGLNDVKTISVIHSSPMGSHIMYMREILRYNKSFDGIWRLVCKIVLFPCYWTYKYLKSKLGLLRHYCELLQRSSAVVVLSKNCRQELEQMTKWVSNKCMIFSIPNPNTYSDVVDCEGAKERIILLNCKQS